MSVLTCSRYGCGNIMCDRYSYVYGYICEECFRELLDLPVDIRHFMETKKSYYCRPTETAWRRILEEEFPS